MSSRLARILQIVLLLLLLGIPQVATAASGRSLGDVAFQMPTPAEVWRVFSLQDHNTRIVLFGVSLLGAAGGLVGVFLLLRKRSLLSDTISHACLPGIGFAFLVGECLFRGGKSLPILLAGATASGLLGIWLVAFLRRRLQLREDAALALILSVLFGAGIVALSLAQQLPSGNAAGLKSFIFGKAASMTTGDAQLIAYLSVGVLALVVALRKELALLCFDEAFAAARGFSVPFLDFALMGLVVASTVIGLQAVGLLLVVALLIIPPAAARFWSDKLTPNLVISATLGAASGALGVAASALLPKFPAGAVIVLAALLLFLASMVFGTTHGMLHRWLESRRLRWSMESEHALRAIYEVLESRAVDTEEVASQTAIGEVSKQELLGRRAWDKHHLSRLLNRLEGGGLLVELEDGRTQLTRAGWNEACRVTRNHRLWELYLIHYADTAPAMVDREADAVEHVVGEAVVLRLEHLMESETPPGRLPPSPHRLATARTS